MKKEEGYFAITPPFVVKVQCKRCGHKWIPRTKALPDRCPGCGSMNWSRPRH